MRRFIIKFLISTVIIYISDILLPNVHFYYAYEYFIIGFTIALVGLLMEALLLRPKRLWLITFLDFLLFTLIINMFLVIFPNASGTFIGAIWAGIIISTSEFFQHRYVIKNVF